MPPTARPTDARTLHADRWFQRALAALALGYSAVRMLHAPGWFADYPGDAGPALNAIAHGNLGGFFAHQPAMGAVSLYLRAPLAMLAAAMGDGPIGVYRWGALPCVISVAVLSLWLARIARAHGAGRPAQGLIVAVCVLNPLIGDALYWGHPEELLTASLAVATLLAAADRRVLVTVLFGGLAIASKQWALLVAVPAVLVWERDRLRGLIGMAAVASAATAPMVVTNFGAFRHALAYIARPQPLMTYSTWMYPFSPSGIVREGNIFGGTRLLTAREVFPVESLVSHPLIIALGVVLPVLVWWSHGRRLAVTEMLLVTALVFLLRCALDPGSVGYYHVPLLLILVALDTRAGGSVPTAGLAGAFGALALFERFPQYLGAPQANLAYIFATAVVAGLLVQRLRRPREGEPARTPPHPSATPALRTAAEA